MDSTLLDKEKFDALKELGAIQTQIAECRAVLSLIQAETESYTAARENDVIARIAALLLASKDVLNQIDKNYAALKHFKDEVDVSRERLTAVLLIFKQLREAQDQVTALDDQRLEDKAKELEDIRNGLSAQRAIIEADALALRAERKWIAEEKVRINDERGTLQRAITRLKQGKI